MPTFSHLGDDASIGDILFAQPDRYGPLLAFANNVMRGDGDLAPETRELLAAFVSGLNDCTFCHGVHMAVAERFGVDPLVLTALLADETQAKIDDALKPIFGFARKLAISPSKIVETDRLAVLDAGHSENTLSDVVAVVSLFSFFNRLVDGHGVKGTAEIFERDSEMLAAFGYVPPTE